MHSTTLHSQSPNPRYLRPHTLRAACLVAAAAPLLAPGLSAQTLSLAPQGETLVLSAGRQKFVPASADPSRANGADFTPLRYSAGTDPDVQMLTARAGVGDSFPMQEEGKLPSGLDKEQQELVKAAGSLPLLLVREGSGKVTRIHVIERQ